MSATRAVRYLGLDRNPLRRRSDRIEAWVTASALATIVIGGPAAAWGAGTEAYRDAVAADSATSGGGLATPGGGLATPGGGLATPGDGIAVEAVLLEDAVYVPPGTEATVAPRRPPVRARWVGPDGTPRNGEITTDAGGPAGTAVVIRTDARGNPVSTAADRQYALERALTLGAMALWGVALPAAVVGLAIRRGLDRRRLVSWQVGWTMVEPRWSGRGSS
jgi:hypothetical protein